MTNEERSKAMDNLIAQDADLIDVPAMTNEQRAALVECIICSECGLEPKRTDTRYGLRLDCCGLWAWGENPLVDAATHEARKVAHAAFDPIWKSGLLKRGDAYGMLANAMGISRKECHMKLMTAAQAARVPAIAAQIREKRNDQ